MKKKAAKRVKARAPKKAASARTTTKPAPTKGKSKSPARETQIPCGDDNKKNKARAGKAVKPPALEELAAVPAATKDGDRSLPPRQRMFVALYLANKGNGKQAAIDAGYSAKTAESQASRLLRNVKVKAAIDAAVAPTLKRLEVTKDYVLECIVLTIERCKRPEQVTVRGVPVEGEFQFDAANVLKGAELLGKHLHMFTDKVEHTGKLTLETLVLGADEVVPA